MMGTKLRDFSPLPNLSLEELVPKDNFYRRLDAMLDLSFVRDLVRDCYASSGRPSVDPVVFFRLQLVMFFEDVRSERQLMEVAADRLSVRWFLGYDLNDPLPDHSSLTRIRERYGLQTFRRFFEEIVELCVEAGLVWGKELYFDATKVEANASLDSMRSRSLMEYDLEEHLAGIFDEEDQPVEKVAGVEKAGIRAYMVLPKHDERRGPLFGKNEFVYDAEKDLYTCPQGQPLHRQGLDYKERSIRYAAKPSACNACPLKSRCTKSKKKGRWIRRSFDEEYLDRVRGYGDTEAYRKALRKRQVWVEPLFGEAKDWHGLRRFRLRRLEKVNVEALLIAAGQNIKRLVAPRNWAPRKLAQAAALRQPAPNPYESCSVRRHRKRCAWRLARVFNKLGCSR